MVCQIVVSATEKLNQGWSEVEDCLISQSQLELQGDGGRCEGPGFLVVASVNSLKE